ncbi:uncharacterized protein LOC116307903 isoform X2 [Actinia tenebrosa]|uniref:Uncharacterized protein LOC116307903 isoform X2 n=1 Tax=Actinia tenebrosa TaxID=6105 RepID=A0A6P8JBQ0_ACTTE|nr:uncharacterized protein LOC116307903 isoform X2 [Actinia tenebrosa]
MDTIGAMIGLAVCSAIFSGIVMVFYIMALSEFSERLRCPEDDYPTHSPSSSSYFLCSRYNQNRRWHVTFYQAEVGAVSCCFLIIAAGFEFFLALMTAMYGCNACYIRTRHRRVSDERQAVGGYDNFTIPYSSVPSRYGAQTVGNQQFISTGFSDQAAIAQPQGAPPRYSAQPQDVPTGFIAQTADTQSQDVPTAFSAQTSENQPQDVTTAFSAQTADNQPQDVPTAFSAQPAGTL